MDFSEVVTLHNGLQMPRVGFDTEKLKPGKEAYEAVRNALAAGYRHIDTSADFGVEKDIARAIADSGIPRNEIFITDEIPTNEKNTAAALHAAEISMKRLNVDYVDLYLIAWTGGKNPEDPANETVWETWKAVENIYKVGNARAIGILDFQPWQVEYLLQNVEIAPMTAMNCIYPGRDIKKLAHCMDEHMIQMEGYLPMKDEGIFSCAELNILADKYKTNVYGVIYQYLRQKDILAILRTAPEEIPTKEIRFTEDEMKYLEVMRDYAPKKEVNA